MARSERNEQLIINNAYYRYPKKIILHYSIVFSGLLKFSGLYYYLEGNPPQFKLYYNAE